MPFGDHLSLKSESNFSNILSLNLCWRLGEEQSLSTRELVLSLNKRCLLAITHRLKSESDFSTILALNMLATWR
jgi:hypothetical protein